MVDNSYFAKVMSDHELVEVVKAMDRASLPLNRRFDGDDTALNDLMDRLELSRNIANKALICGEILRECCVRGLKIDRSN